MRSITNYAASGSKRKQNPDPDPHQSEKMKALEGHFGVLEGPNLGKSEW
jgi:hypothetical protein